jgi:hypothetical protein
MKETGKPCTKILELVEKFTNVCVLVARVEYGDI